MKNYKLLLTILAMVFLFSTSSFGNSKVSGPNKKSSVKRPHFKKRRAPTQSISCKKAYQKLVPSQTNVFSIGRKSIAKKVTDFDILFNNLEKELMHPMKYKKEFLKNQRNNNTAPKYSDYERLYTSYKVTLIDELKFIVKELRNYQQTNKQIEIVIDFIEYIRTSKNYNIILPKDNPSVRGRVHLHDYFKTYYYNFKGIVGEIDILLRLNNVLSGSFRFKELAEENGSNKIIPIKDLIENKRSEINWMIENTQGKKRREYIENLKKTFPQLLPKHIDASNIDNEFKNISKIIHNKEFDGLIQTKSGRLGLVEIKNNYDVLTLEKLQIRPHSSRYNALERTLLAREMILFLNLEKDMDLFFYTTRGMTIETQDFLEKKGIICRSLNYSEYN